MKLNLAGTVQELIEKIKSRGTMPEAVKSNLKVCSTGFYGKLHECSPSDYLGDVVAEGNKEDHEKQLFLF
jgi:hypothetical protein